MFCKSGILIFIFAENNYSIYAHTMLIKTPLLHQSLGPCVCLSLSLSLSLYFWLISWNAKVSYITQEILAFFLLSLSRHGLWTTRFQSIKGPQHPAIRVDSLPAELPGKPLETPQSVQFSHSVMSDSLRPHESQHARPPCPSQTPRVHSDSSPLSQ